MGDSSTDSAKADPPKPSTSQQASTGGKYSDPVFKQISLSNGKVNKMTKDELKAQLAELRMDTRGVKEVLSKRLKSHYQRQKLRQAKVKNLEDAEMVDYFVVIDYEATCEENAHAYPHEIIEFPAVLVCTKKFIVKDEFQAFCRPTINPTLTKFCTTLTGISQELVDRADYFPEVLARFQVWMDGHGLGGESSFVVVTDGPWDMSRFLHSQCNQCRLPFPRWAKKWINIRKCYRNYYGFKNAKLATMLENLGMEFQGQQHSGIDDARNIARIAVRLLGDGAVLHANEKIFSRYWKENKRMCIDVVSCKKEENGEGDAHDAPEVDVDQEAVVYTYNGQFEVGPVTETGSGDRNKTTVKKESKETCESENSPVEDVSDLMYWMKLKGK